MVHLAALRRQGSAVRRTDAFGQAALAALRRVPALRACYRAGEVVPYREPRIGQAVATPAGLLSWAVGDPLRRWTAVVTAAGWAQMDELSRWDAQTRAAIAEVWQRAQATEWPDPAPGRQDVRA